MPRIYLLLILVNPTPVYAEQTNPLVAEINIPPVAEPLILDFPAMKNTEYMPLIPEPPPVPTWRCGTRVDDTPKPRPFATLRKAMFVYHHIDYILGGNPWSYTIKLQLH